MKRKYDSSKIDRAASVIVRGGIINPNQSGVQAFLPSCAGDYSRTVRNPFIEAAGSLSQLRAHDVSFLERSKKIIY